VEKKPLEVSLHFRQWRREVPE